MGIFESIGRTNALSTGVKALSDTALEMRRISGNERQIAIGEQDLAIRQNEEMRKQKEFDAKENLLDSVVPVDSVLNGVGPKAQKYLMDLGEQNGWLEEVGGVKTISNRNLQAAGVMLKNNVSMMKEIDELELGDVNNQIQTLFGQLQNPDTKDKDKEAMGQQLMQAKKKQIVLLNSINTMDKEVRKAIATSTAKNRTVDNIKAEVLEKSIMGAELNESEQKLYNTMMETDSAAPAVVKTTEYLINNGLAKNRKEAFRMARELGTMTRSQFLAQLKIKMTSDPFNIDSEEEINTKLSEADDWFKYNIEGEIPPATVETSEDGKTISIRKKIDISDPANIRK